MIQTIATKERMRANTVQPIPYKELPFSGISKGGIETLWRYQSEVTRRQLVLPDGRMDLVVRGTVTPTGRVSAVRVAVAGPADQPGFVVTPAATVTMGVRFRVGWGGKCLNVEAHSLRNQVVIGRAANALVGPISQGLLRARSLDELQQALMESATSMSDRAAPSAGHARVLQAVESVRYGAAIGTIGAQIGSAERTLRRDVITAVGLPLRTLEGIFRFQGAMARLQAGTVRDLSRLALEAGYSDQAHMTRAFRRFGNFTPSMPEAAPVVEIDCGAWPKRSRRERTGQPHSATT